MEFTLKMWQDYIDFFQHIAFVDQRQINFGKTFGLNFTNCTTTLAFAKLMDFVDINFNNIQKLGSPTTKQTNFALKNGIDISQMSHREGNAVVDDIMTELNLRTIEKYSLCSGANVINIFKSSNIIYTISSIKDDGMCYFRGGNGKKAWARNLRPIGNNT